MSLDLNNLSVDDLAGLITKGVGNTLEDILYQDFKAQAEVAARRAAKELAERVSAQITGMKRHDTMDIRLDMSFNMISPEATPAGQIVGVRDGIPLIAWSLKTQDLNGKKIFIA